MRTIKFRGLTKKGEWVHGSYYKGMDRHYIAIPLEAMKEVNPKTVGQFTGLKDKNGVDIWEGDILKYNTYPKKLIVEYKEGNAQFLCGLSTYFWDRAEVIGNIHQHPELLGQK